MSATSAPIHHAALDAACDTRHLDPTAPLFVNRYRLTPEEVTEIERHSSALEHYDAVVHLCEQYNRTTVEALRETVREQLAGLAEIDAALGGGSSARHD